MNNYLDLLNPIYPEKITFSFINFLLKEESSHFTAAQYNIKNMPFCHKMDTTI